MPIPARHARAALVPGVQPGTGDTPASDGFSFQIRDVGNAGKAGWFAILDFSQTDLPLYADQESGTTVDCARRYIYRLTDSHGDATLHPRFGGFVNAPLITVSASGVTLGEVPARSTDMNGLGGVTDLSDLSIFMPLYLSRSTSHPEADFNASGGPIDLADLTIMVREYESGAHSATCP